jgi:GDP/UDP-N,N'-diacetylbacillosamine 2-epimerase (hydrolysing)
MKRKICCVVASRANYARVKYLLKAIKNHPDLELQLIVGASTLLYRFGSAIEIIKEDGFLPVKEVYYVVEGENLATQAKSTGLGLIELTTALSELKPDIVVTVADRFETMANAIASTYLNIPLAHIQGGEITGNIDERVRHAITKLADIHFPSTEKSKERIIKMGESPEYVFNFGCPAMDILENENLEINNKIMSRYGGTGKPIDWNEPYFLVVQHPVTTSPEDGLKQINTTLESLKEFPEYQKIILWPNVDAGSDLVSKGLRIFKEKNKFSKIHFFRNFSPEDYARVLNNAKCLIGNSSSFIREGSYLGIPAVLIGERQQGREHGKNVVFSDYNKEQIIDSIKKQIEHGRYRNEHLFGDGNAGVRIAKKLSEIKLSIKKRMTY